MKKAHWIIGAWVAMTLPVAGQESSSESRSFSREQAELYAVEHSYSTRIDALERERVKAVIFENVSLGLPQVSASGTFTDNIEIQQQVIEFNGQLTPLAFGVRYGSGASLQVDQLIIDGSYFVALAATKVLRLNAANAYEKSAIEVREDVANAYHLVLTTERSLETIRENLNFIRQSLYETRELFKAGFAEKTDVDQLDLLLTNLEANEDFLERQVVVSRSILKYNMGIPVRETIQLTDNIEGLISVATQSSEILQEEFNATGHIDYRTLQSGIRGQELNIANEQVQWLPRLSAYYSYNHQFQSPTFDNLYSPDGSQSFDFTFSSWGLSLRWSLFAGGRKFARVQEAKVALDKLQVQEEMLKDGLQVEFETARSQYAFALNNYLAAAKSVQISRDIRDQSSIKFSEGVITSLEFTTAERQYQDALNDMFNATQQTLDAKVNLERILGRFNLNMNQQ